MKSKTIFWVILAAGIAAFAPTDAIGGGWGIERGRATEGDAARLVADQVAMRMAQNQINEAVSRPLGAERKRQLLGGAGSQLDSGELMDSVYEWWLKGVMEPANAISENPAASCAESTIAVRTLLIMMRQRQLIGMTPDENDHSKTANDARTMELRIGGLLDDARTNLVTRCREEAFDECVATGRFYQIVQTDLGLSRDEALFPKNSGSDSNALWVDEALSKCAVYELHFVSTTKVVPAMNMETVLDGKVTLKFDAGAGGLYLALDNGGKLEDFLKGKTEGKENPFLVSVKCIMPGVSVVCSPGATVSPVMNRVFAMEMRHREFYVDPNGVSRERLNGEDKFRFEFSGGLFSIGALIKIPSGPTMPLPMPAQGYAFYIAHKKDRGTEAGAGTSVRVESVRRGAYPVIFDFKYVDQGSESNVPASDSTEFQLIHKPPKQDEFKRKPEEPRKPLKPRPGMAVSV